MAPATPGTPTTPTTPTTPGGTTSRPGGATTTPGGTTGGTTGGSATPGGTTGGTTGGSATPTTPGGTAVEPLVATGAIYGAVEPTDFGAAREDRGSEELALSVDFREGTADDLSHGHAIDRSRYSGGSRMDATLGQFAGLMDGHGGFRYDMPAGAYSPMAASGFTMGLMVKVPTTEFGGARNPSPHDHVLLSTMESKGSVGFELVQEGDTLVANYVSAPGARPVKLVATGLAARRWTGATLVQGSGVLTLYVNGKAVCSAPAAGLTGTPGDVTLGFRASADRVSPGSTTTIEQAAVRNTAVTQATLISRALSADEVAARTVARAS